MGCIEDIIFPGLPIGGCTNPDLFHYRYSEQGVFLWQQFPLVACLSRVSHRTGWAVRHGKQEGEKSSFNSLIPFLRLAGLPPMLSCAS